MLYVYYGNDQARTADALMGTIEKLRERAPQASIERITNEAEMLELEPLLASHGLFHAARIVILDGVFENAAHKKEVLDALSDISASDHVFFIREPSLTAAELKRLEKHAKKITEYSMRERGRESFNTFALADALLARDRKGLWLKLQQALRTGSGPEELHGILFWGAKNLALAASASDAKEAGMHPFVYQKTSRALSKFAPGEVNMLIADLAALPHESRRKGVELEYTLEEFALGV